MLSELKAAFAVLKGLVRLAIAIISIRFFLSRQLRAAERGLRQELLAKGLPREAVEELARAFRRSARELAGGLTGFTGIRRWLAAARG